MSDRKEKGRTSERKRNTSIIERNIKAAGISKSNSKLNMADKTIKNGKRKSGTIEKRVKSVEGYRNEQRKFNKTAHIIK